MYKSYCLYTGDRYTSMKRVIRGWRTMVAHTNYINALFDNQAWQHGPFNSSWHIMQ